MLKTELKTKAKKRTYVDDDKRKEIKNLFEGIEKNWFIISKNLSEIYDNKIFLNWGFNTFEEYVKHDLPFLSYRLALWKVQIGQAIRRLGLKEDIIGKMGWTKFKELCYLFNDNTTEDEAYQIINELKDKTYEQVRDYVIDIRNKKGEAIEKKITITFRVTEDAARIIDNAIKEAGELIGENASIGTKIEYICAEWHLHHNPAKRGEDA